MGVCLRLTALAAAVALGAVIAWPPTAAAVVLDTTFVRPPEGQETTSFASREGPARWMAGRAMTCSKAEPGPTS